MPGRMVGWLGVVLAGCAFSPPKCPPGALLVAVDGGWGCGNADLLTITDQLCDGGTMTFQAPNQGRGTLTVYEPCSPKTVSILEAPCVQPPNGGWPNTRGSLASVPQASFTLPPGFDPRQGDMAPLASECCPQGDGGVSCIQFSPLSRERWTPGKPALVGCNPKCKTFLSVIH